MRRISVDDIKGTEILAMDIFNDTGITLMVAGTVIKKEYAQKLRSLNINYMYVKDEIEKDIDTDEIIELKIKEQCQEQVKEAIELYASYGIQELTPILAIADNIISDVLEEPEVVYNICGIRERSEGVFAHSVNVCALSVLIAIRMKLPTDKIRDIAVGCLVHDIGITYYSSKYEVDEGEITEATWPEYKQHVIYGYSMLNPQKWISAAAKDIVLLHHEKIDGSGYPFGLSGKKIKKSIRIVSVCDTFDRLVYGMTGKKYKVCDAIEYIMSQSEVKFDINVVKTFLDTVAAYPNGSVVKTNRGDKAIVLRQNRKCPSRPVIRLLEDEDGVSYKEEIEVNLVEDLTLFITETEI